MRKKKIVFISVLVVSIAICSCTKKENIPSSGNIASVDNKEMTLMDSLGNTFPIKDQARIVSLYGSFAECYLLAGGSLVGVTSDAIKERKLSLAEDVAMVGSVKEPSLEQIVALNPDYVIMSADLTQHLALKKSFDALSIPYGYFRMDTFEDYENMMKEFCEYTKRDDCYQKNVVQVKEQIDRIKEAVKIEQNQLVREDGKPKTVLLMRAFSSGFKAKGSDNQAGTIIQEFGCHNIVDDYPSMLEELSMEEIIHCDPDYIFVLTMGEEEKALDYLDSQIKKNSAWQQLKAVKEDHMIVLPKELFHYKPNNRWAESYEYLAKELYQSIKLS